MSRLSSNYANNEKSAQLLNEVQKTYGNIHNFFKILGNSSTILAGFLAFGNGLKNGVLSEQEREQIAIAVAGYDQCEYCASAHTLFAINAGVPENETKKNLKGLSDSKKIGTLIKFCLAILQNKGEVSDEEMALIREAGYTDEAIVEIVANVGINIFTNYFNHVAQTDLDFPQVHLNDNTLG